MSIALSTRGVLRSRLVEPVLGRISRMPCPPEQRGDIVRLLDDEANGEDLSGYAAVAARFPWAWPVAGPVVEGLEQSAHLADGDIVSIAPSGYVRTLYRAGSPNNSLFATDSCNSYCVMCSQPPKPSGNEGRVAQLLRLIDLIEHPPAELGITGGEPTLLKRGLLEVVARAKERLPSTALHILSNGRLFMYADFAEELAEIRHPDLMMGIPLYSDIDYLHDHVVQAAGAFDETVMGLCNLGLCRVSVEIRVVIHRFTMDRLPQLAEFIYRNLTFVSQVAFMGLEPMGFAVSNLDQLWAEPTDYAPQLRAAVLSLSGHGIKASIYNHQLCVLPRDLWRFCRKSISDWKNDYLPMCSECAVRNECGGFFSSSLRRRVPKGVRPQQLT